jgi:hypothetical protein
MSDSTAPFISEAPGSFEDQGGVVFPSDIHETTNWFDSLRQVGRGLGYASAEYGDIDEYGRQITQPEATTAPDVLNQKYGIPGKLSFDRSLPESVAQSINQNKQEEVRRADAIERQPPGFLQTANRYGAQFVADMLDPLNIAATMVPIAPEIDFGVTAASGLLERTAQRAVQGGVQGAAGMLPLAGLKYTLGRQEQSDYDGYSALADVASGAGIGAILHAGGGALGDLLTSRVLSQYGDQLRDSVDGRLAKLRASVAQMAEDRPVSVDFNPLLMEPGGNAPFPLEEQIEPYAPGPVPERILEPTQPEAVTPGATPIHPEPAEPQRLLSFLVQGGGIKDPGGDVSATIGGPRGRPGLISANGRNLDDAALNAWQAGYFPSHSERPSTNDLLRAIDEDYRGNPQYSHHDEAAVQNYQAARAQNGEVLRLASELGLPTQNITREQFFDAAHEHLTPEDFDARVGAEADRAQASYEDAERQAAAWVAEPRLAEVEGHEPHGDVTELYGDQHRSLEDLENEYRQENAAAAARERVGGGQPGRSPSPDQAGVPAGGEPGRGGAGPTGREGALADALRAARGQPTGPDRFSADADASARLRPPEELKRAQTDIDTQSEFFGRLDPETLSEEFKAELAAIDNIDTEAKGYGDAAMQAGACIARGMGSA